MNQFLEWHNLPKLTQEEIDYLNRPIFIKEIETIINNLSKQKPPSPDGFTTEIDQTFKEEITLILFNLIQKTEVEKTLPNSFYDTNVTLIPKSDKNITRNRQTSISYEHRCKNSQKDTSKSNPTMNKKNYTSWPSGLYPRYESPAQHLKII